MRAGAISLLVLLASVLCAPISGGRLLRNDDDGSQIIVAYESSSSFSQTISGSGTTLSFFQLASGAEGQVISSITLGMGRSLEVIKLTKGADETEAIREIESMPGVRYAEPNYRWYTTKVPNDPSYGELWSMQKVEAELAWDIMAENGFTKKKVCIIDTG